MAVERIPATAGIMRLTGMNDALGHISALVHAQGGRTDVAWLSSIRRNLEMLANMQAGGVGETAEIGFCINRESGTGFAWPPVFPRVMFY